jgi:hypothetical protein
MGENRLLHGSELLSYASVVGFDLPAPQGGRTASRRSVRRCPKTDPPQRPVRVGVIDARMAPHPHVEGAYLADPDRLDLLPEDGGRPLTRSRSAVGCRECAPRRRDRRSSGGRCACTPGNRVSKCVLRHPTV